MSISVATQKFCEIKQYAESIKKVCESRNFVKNMIIFFVSEEQILFRNFLCKTFQHNLD